MNAVHRQQRRLRCLACLAQVNSAEPRAATAQLAHAAAASVSIHVPSAR
eukprot:CAMPEP_0182835320 /NCGR_PEP_ID=MMETSP0006_2-20121128/21432_1 /TAXON_ID=97485 /ORGANISM="Prymnesium parvum, Strain Texoma1" /LENGTH=48 /DNA_ID= /DNA_START= /DNA_END= /DNA_ORIENTATION=